MPTVKPELSNKNKFWIPKHRYYELKHYCLQYPQWKKLYSQIEFKMAADPERMGIRGSEPANPTERYAIIRAECKRAMEMVENCTDEACKQEPIIAGYLLRGVTIGRSYTYLREIDLIPCSKEMYYHYYRKFFYILSQRRGL